LQDTVGLALYGTSSEYVEVSSSGRVTFDNNVVLTDLETRINRNSRMYRFGIQYNGYTMRSFNFTFRGFGDGRMTGSYYTAQYAHATSL